MTAKKLGRAPRVDIEVTSEAIAEAVTRNSNSCMIADSIKAALPNAERVSVDIQTIRWSDSKKGERYVYLTPRIAQIALVDFDQGTTIEPFSFRTGAGQTIRSQKGRIKTPRAKAEINHHGQTDMVPDIHGGKAPPMAALSNWAKPGPAKGTPKNHKAGQEQFDGKTSNVTKTVGSRRTYGARLLTY